LAVAAKASAADRLARYQDVDSLAADVGRFLNGQSVTAYRENLYERAAAWIGRNKTVSVLVLAYITMRALLIFFMGR
jgi:hypothetical protein